jgi:hypothetical protein
VPVINLDSEGLEGPNAKRADKIAKLLRKAEASDNEHERQSLTEAAERLMIQWGIEDAMIRAAQAGQDASNVQTDKITERSTVYRGRFARAYLEIGAQAAGALGLKTFYIQPDWDELTQNFVKTPGSLLKLILVGFESDIALAMQLGDSLVNQGRHALNVWWAKAKSDDDPYWAMQIRNSTAHEKFVSQREFLFQFGYEAAYRIYTLYRRVQNDMTAQHGQSTELALLDRDALLEKYMSENHGNLRKDRIRARSNLGGAIDAGKEAGRRADIGQKAARGTPQHRELGSN